ncbi:hypothetical protein BHE74_00039643 [Ensete ventricosum]|nr:hypothetical protein BHE74_00039643 [Ensete ventricosum]
MLQERSTAVNPREDVPPVTQPTSGGTLQPPLSISSFGDRNMPSHTPGRYWSLLNDPGLTPPPSNPRTPVKGQPSMTYSVDNLPHFSPESDQAPSGGMRPAPAPSASAHSLLDPDTFSSDSTDSLREQLRLVNQRIDDVRKTLRTKDERGESPLCGSPFVQEIHDALIPPNFPLPMLEAYDGSSDPTEQMATFHVSMTPSDVIMEFDANFLSSARPKPTVASLLGMRQKEEEQLGQYLTCFTEEIRVIPDVHPSLVIQAFMIGIRPSRLFWSLVERSPHDCTINAAKGQPVAKDRDCRRYCRFHHDYGHDTKECYDLKNQIEDLIRRSHLDWYIMKSHEPSLRPKGHVERQVDVIMGGPTMGGISSSARKAYARVEIQKRLRARSNPGTTFESESEYPDYDDALKVTVVLQTPASDTS